MLYVSNLPFGVDDEQLQEVFAEFDVTSAYVAVRRNGRSKGFGFVSFGSADEQQKALEKADGLELEGRTLNVNVAHKDERRDSKGVLKEEFKNTERKNNGGRRRGNDDSEPSQTIVYVSNLPFQYEDSDLVELFEGLAVKSARVARRRNDRSKGFAFVEFETNEDQEKALEKDGEEIDGRSINVQKSRTTQVEQKQERQQQDQGSENTVFISNLPFQLEDEELVAAFTDAGLAVKEARVARRANGNSKGFGFVELEEESTVEDAIKALDQTEIGERTVTLKDSKNNNRRGGNKKPQQQRRAPREKRDSETLVYVSNLAFQVEDAELEELFSGLAIKSCHVARRRNGRSKGFGFVEFETNADQQTALEKDGAEFNDRALTVQVAREDVEEAGENDNNDE
jgi:RNA recognition motif-containing protein